MSTQQSLEPERERTARVGVWKTMVTDPCHQKSMWNSTENGKYLRDPCPHCQNTQGYTNRTKEFATNTPSMKALTGNRIMPRYKHNGHYQQPEMLGKIKWLSKVGEERKSDKIRIIGISDNSNEGTKKIMG